jgi:threonine/homoserine/homoserine lactone efflux protein
MPDSAQLLLFLTAALLLAIARGPGMLYVLARSLAGGKREGVLSALGTFLGGMIHVFAAALGVSVILARSALAFSTVKYLGAAYLCSLGVRMIINARKETGEAEAGSTNSPSATDGPGVRNPLWQGIATEALNPKTVLFFLSFIPQFDPPGWTCIFSVRCSGNCFCNSEYFGGYTRHPAGGTAGGKTPLVSGIPPSTENADGRHHDWPGNLPGDKRKALGIVDFYSSMFYSSMI